MPFSKRLVILLILAFNTVAQNVDTDWIDENQKQQKAYLEQLKKNGQLDIFSQDYIEDKAKQHNASAKALSDKSVKAKTFSMSQYDGLNATDSGASIQAQKATPEKLKAIFVSYSMTNSELSQAFLAASEQGAEIYLNGLHPDDQNIGQTMKRLRKAAADLKVLPNARFHPKAFKEFNVTSVPYLIYLSPGKALSVSGLLNFDWLIEKGEYSSGRVDFGIQGPTKPVIEMNLLDDIQLRLSRVDFEQKKKAAVENFWAKRNYVSLPRSQKAEIWYIDPTVKVTADITNHKGEVLARKGQVLNPLDAVPALNTYVIFNARDIKQLEWADAQKQSGKLPGTVMFLSSEFDKQKGWDHLSALRAQFKQEIFLLPKEMVDRFNITGLPAIVTTDLERKLLKVEQFKII